MCGWLVLQFPCRDNNQERHYFRRLHLYCSKAAQKGFKVCPDVSEQGLGWQKTYVLAAPDRPGFEMCPLCRLCKRRELVDLAGFSFIPSLFVHQAPWMEFESGFQHRYLNTYVAPNNLEMENIFLKDEDMILKVQQLAAGDMEQDVSGRLNQIHTDAG